MIGLGYVGLPLAISFVEAGLDRRRHRRLPGRVAELNAGSSPIDDISDERLGAALGQRPAVVVAPADAGSPTPTRSSSASRRRSPTTKDPDLAPVLSAAETIREHLRARPARRPPVDDLPGHDDRAVPRGPRAERAQGRRRLRPRLRARAGQPGRSRRVPARASRASSARRRRRPATERAAALLRNINDQVVELSSPDAAELAKLLENVFRNVNIAFVNQLALLCERMGLDVWEVINAAATKPFGFMKFTPGPGRRRPLHPGRSVLPGLAGPRVRLHRSLHRAGRRHQLRDAAPRRRPRRRGAQRPRPGAQGRQGRRPRRGVQAERPRRPQLAGGRRHRRASPSAAPTSGSTTRTSPTFKDAAGAMRDETPTSTSCSAGPTSIVVVTAHRAIDWDDASTSDADLVVDTVDTRAGARPARARSCAWAPAGRRATP